MKTLLLRITTILLLVIMYSCNQEKIQSETPTPVEDFKAKKQKKIQGYLDYVHKITTPIGEKESGYSSKHFIQEYTKAKKRRVELSKSGKLLTRAASTSITWQERGPANIPGRMRSIAIHPTNKDFWYAGTVGGGVWKTEDGGATFTNLTDGKIPSIATSYVVFSEANVNTIYAGTGESYFNSDAIDGIGLMKSMDAGNTWTYLQNTLMMEDVSRIAISPADENILVVTSRTGLYKTTDGGSTWSKKLSSNFNDLKAAPSDFNTMYAYDTDNKIIIKSIDAGETWNTVFSNPSLPDFNRIELAISPLDANKIYGSVHTGGNDQIILTEDGGQNWALIMEGSDSSLYNDFLGGQGWYDNALQVHPIDDNIIYCGGVNLYKMVISDSGGSKVRTTTPLTDVYSRVTGAYKNANVHPDQHVIEIIRGTGNEIKLIVGNDGGIAISNMAEDPGINDGDWPVGTVIGMNTTQYYGADKKNGVSQYVGGAQDNGSHLSPVNSTNTSSFSEVWGGDGFECAWNYNDPNKIVVAAQYNQLGVSINGGQNFLFANLSNGGSPFLSRIANSKNNPDFIYAMDAYGVWKSENFGLNWNRKSVDFFGGDNGDVAVSLANPEIIWASGVFGSSSNYQMFVSKDLGESFEATNQSSTDFNAYISGIETHPTEENTAYVLFSLKGRAKILKTEDLGQTWTDITGFPQTGKGTSSKGFPDVAVHSLVVMPYDTDVIWAGTDLGIFQTVDGGESWVYLDEVLPTVSIWDMRIVNDEVVIATHGRGIWTAKIPELAGYEPLPYVIAPKIEHAYQKWKESTINITLNLPSDYDDTKILINDVEVESLGATSKGTQINKEISINQGVSEVTVKLVSNKNTSEKTSNIVTIPLINFNDITEVYIDNLEEISDNFLGYYYENALATAYSFSYYNIGWSTGNFILNEDVPYANNAQYIAMLNKPIKIIGDETSVMKFQNIAIVEPGDSSGLWDYVVVEATNDGLNWIELTEKYDANFDESWLANYDAGSIPTEDNYRQRIIDLNNFFAKDDTILIRFRLEADSSLNTYGWFIDDIEIQKQKADLVPDKISIDSEVVSGQNARFSFEVSNKGTIASEETLGTLYYSTNSIFDSNAVVIGTHTIPILDSGQQIIITESYKIPENLLSSETYYFHYQVNTDTIVEENDIENNIISTELILTETISNNNFIIKVENETCENKDNGSINVTTKETLNYTYTLSSDSLSEEGTFTNTLSFDNLAAGTYTLCFGLENNTSYEQCFDIVVGEPSNLLASTVVNKVSRTVTVNIAGGTAPYNINLNGRTYSVNTTSIDLPLAEGSNTITISSDIVCEGTIVDVINTKETSEVKAYPNPVDNQLFITIPSSYSLNQIPIQIYNAKGQLIMNNFYSIHNRKVEVNAISLGSGLYFVKVGNLETVKIIKK